MLDDEEVDFDTFVNGKYMAKAYDELARFCKSHGLKSVEDFYSQDVSEFMDELEDLDIPEQEVEWFEPQEGISWINELVTNLKDSTAAFSAEPVIEDLKEYKSVLEKAKNLGVKWHFELDI